MYNYSTFKIMVSANTGVGQFTFMSNADTMIFSGNGTFFYTDSAGTLGKSNNINLTKNVSKVIYIRSATAGYINFTKSKITKLVYISVSSEPSVSFDISALTALTYLYLGGSNTCSGSIAALTALTYLVLGGPNTCIINSVINETGLCYLDIESIILTQAVVDQILLDFWTNKDLAKSRSERIIKITGKTGSSAPSATGATYVSELAAYRSPHNNSLYNYWTVTTR